MPFYIDVIIPNVLEKYFAYSVNEAEYKFIVPGMRVAVSFGKKGIYTAIVRRLHEQAPLEYDVKDIEFIIDETPIVTEQQLKFWEWVASYYCCSVGLVMKAALPRSLMLESETIILKNEETVIVEGDLSDQEFLIMEALENRKAIKVDEVMDILDRKTVLPMLKKMLSKDYILLQEEVYNTYKPKTNAFIFLDNLYQDDDALKNLLDNELTSEKQRKAVLTLFMLKAGSDKLVTSKELENRSGISRAVIKALIIKNIFKEEHKTIDRVLAEREAGKSIYELNPSQQIAYEQIKICFATKKPTLLYGVTSSGKTEIYVRLIKEQLESGKQCLYLLPEIALTTQLIARLRVYFKHQVLVYHSKYNLNERLEVWNHVLNPHEPFVIIGARSALWLPISNLGLIIIDEEHEPSFKQTDPAPRYNARDAAIVLAGQVNAQILLGSATPALETYNNAVKGKFNLVTLTKRYGNVLMPNIELVDIKDKHHRKQMSGHFSDTLINHIQEAFKNKKQVLLFQNRRGYAPIMECNTCGHAPQCPNCDVSLTFHQFKNQLRCHYCGFHEPMHQECQACSSTDVDTKGFGTEQIEQEFQALFPHHKVARMDLDTTRGKDSHEKLIAQMENGSIDCLVGTQMVSKGLDFRNVSLVGIMNADAMLNLPDFRAHERCFQLLTQVAGRAGRTIEQGKVLIQTYNLHHQILQQVSNYNYEEMYREQMEDRYQFKYPPYQRLIKLTFKHKDYNTTLQAAQWFADALNQLNDGIIVLGPEFPAVSRMRNLYHINLIIKISPKQKPAVIKSFVKRIQRSFEAIKTFRSVRCNIDVDNY